MALAAPSQGASNRQHRVLKITAAGMSQMTSARSSRASTASPEAAPNSAASTERRRASTRAQAVVTMASAKTVTGPSMPLTWFASALGPLTTTTTAKIAAPVWG